MRMLAWLYVLVRYRSAIACAARRGWLLSQLADTGWKYERIDTGPWIAHLLLPPPSGVPHVTPSGIKR